MDNATKIKSYNVVLKVFGFHSLEEYGEDCADRLYGHCSCSSGVHGGAVDDVLFGWKPTEAEVSFVIKARDSYQAIGVAVEVIRDVFPEASVKLDEVSDWPDYPDEEK